MRARRRPASTLLLVVVAFIVIATLLRLRCGAIGVAPQVSYVVPLAAELHVIHAGPTVDADDAEASGFSCQSLP